MLRFPVLSSFLLLAVLSSGDAGVAELPHSAQHYGLGDLGGLLKSVLGFNSEDDTSDAIAVSDAESSTESPHTHTHSPSHKHPHKPHKHPHKHPHRRPPPPSPREVEAVGRGRVTAQPDQARIYCYAKAQASKALTAKEALDAVVSHMCTQLETLGVTEITHTTFSVTRRTNWNDGQETFLYYEASQPVEILVSLSNGTAVLEEVVNTVLSSDTGSPSDTTHTVHTPPIVTFELSQIVPLVSDEEKYITQARQLAVKDAEAIANQLAEPLGVNVGLPKKLQFVGGAVPLPLVRARGVSPVSMVGDQTLTYEAQVDAVFDLLPKRFDEDRERLVIF